MQVHQLEGSNKWVYIDCMDFIDYKWAKLIVLCVIAFIAALFGRNPDRFTGGDMFSDKDKEKDSK